MRAYFAVGDGATALRHLPGRRALISYAYVRKGAASWLKPKQLEKLPAVVAGLMIDSGAFTAWKQGAPIGFDEYFAWLTSSAPPHEYAIGLDVIGDAEASLRNYDAAAKLVPGIVPVWHEGDPAEHLAHYVARAPLVALGRIAGRDSDQKTLEFYDAAFNRAPDGTFHALGNSTIATLEPYPFFSFDSTGWQRDAAYSEAARWPMNRCSKDTRLRAYIEAFESVRHVPRDQSELFGWKPKAAKAS